MRFKDTLKRGKSRYTIFWISDTDREQSGWPTVLSA